VSWWVGDQQQESGQFWGCKVCLCLGGWEISNRRVGSFGVVGCACVLVGGRSATGGWAALGL